MVRCVIGDGPTHSAGICLPPRRATCIGRPSPICASNGCAAKPRRRAVRSARSEAAAIAFAVAHLWFDCLRLAAIESVARRFTAPPPAPRSRPGKDYRAMVTAGPPPRPAAVPPRTRVHGRGGPDAGARRWRQRRPLCGAEASCFGRFRTTDAGELVILKHRDRRTGITKEFIAHRRLHRPPARARSRSRPGGIRRLRSTIAGRSANRSACDGSRRRRALSRCCAFRPALGRALSADDARQGAPPVMMHRLRAVADAVRSDPGDRPDACGSGNKRRMVVGVAPPRLPVSATVAHRSGRPRMALPPRRQHSASRAGCSPSAG